MLSASQRRLVRVQQQAANDCGAACLTSVAAYYGRVLPLAKVHGLASSRSTGTSLLGLSQAARSLGLIPRGVRSTIELVPEVPLPAIAHVTLEGREHYVVVYAASREHVTYMDPDDGGVHRVSRAAFAAMWSGILLLLAPGDAFEPGTETVSLAGYARRRVGAYLAPLSVAVAAGAGSALSGVVVAIYVQRLFDALGAGAGGRLAPVAVLTGVLLTTLTLLAYAHELLLLHVGGRIGADLTLDYYRHLVRLPQRQFATRRVVDWTARVNDAATVRTAVSTVATRVLLNAAACLVALITLAVYSRVLALVALAGTALVVASHWAAERARRRDRRPLRADAERLEVWLTESVENIGALQESGAETSAIHETAGRLARFYGVADRGTRGAAAARFGAELATRLALVVILAVGGRLAARGDLSIGELAASVVLLGYVAAPVATALAAVRDLLEARPAAERVLDVLALPPDGGGGMLRRPLADDLRLEGVALRGPGGPGVFDGLTLTVRRGLVTALVGDHGAGKTAVVALLSRREIPERGAVRIGAVNLAQVDPASLHAGVGIVPQRVELFTDTVLANVALGQPAPDVPRVAELCVRLGLDEFLGPMPHSLQAVLVHRGARLRPDQQKAIALARVLFRAPDVLLVDEADFASDKVARTLETFRDLGGTVLLATRHPRAVLFADRILVLRQGRLVEEGTHAELLSRGGEYHRLWARDVGGVELARADGGHACANGHHAPRGPT